MTSLPELPQGNFVDEAVALIAQRQEKEAAIIKEFGEWHRAMLAVNERLGGELVRTGEVVIRDKSGMKNKSVKAFWVPNVFDKGVREGFSDLIPNDEDLRGNASVADLLWIPERPLDGMVLYDHITEKIMYNVSPKIVKQAGDLIIEAGLKRIERKFSHDVVPKPLPDIPSVA